MTMTNTDKILNLQETQEIELFKMQGWPAGGYRLSKAHAGAIQAAYFAQRPLLVRGDPGLGKSQLAQAIACYLNWGLVTSVVHYNTHIEDLLFNQDHLERLYDANRQSAVGKDNADDNDDESKLAPKNYIRPGKIWQAMAPGTVSDYSCERPHTKKGTVLLIDEIDKADSSLPNALLEVLNNRSISIPFKNDPIQEKSHPLFVVITSNDERLLPQAFLRRCAILDLRLSEDKEKAQLELIDIYNTHKNYNPELSLDEALVKEAAKLVVEQRGKQSKEEYHAGTSEFLDLIKALCQFPEQNSENLKMLSTHLINKNQQRV